MISFRIHDRFEISDGSVMLQGLMDFSGELKFFDVFLDEKISPVALGKFDLGRITDFSYYPVLIGQQQEIYFVIRQDSMNATANSDVENPGDVMVIEVRTTEERAQLRMIRVPHGMLVISGPGKMLDMSGLLPEKITKAELKKRKKISSETYYSDEGFLSDFQERAEELGLEEDTAMAIYAEGEKMAFEVAEDSVFLDPDQFLGFLQNEILEVREVIMVMLEQAAA